MKLNVSVLKQSFAIYCLKEKKGKILLSPCGAAETNLTGIHSDVA